MERLRPYNEEFETWEDLDKIVKEIKNFMAKKNKCDCLSINCCILVYFFV